MQRGMTSAAVTQMLEGKDNLRCLADIGLRDKVDGDTLIGAVQSCGFASPAALEPLFNVGAAAGALARLAQQIKRHLQVEAELAKAEKNDRKHERDAEKQRKLEVAMAKERVVYPILNS